MSIKRPGEKGLSERLLEVYDSFTEFNDCCSFLCEAFAALLGESKERDFDDYTIRGAKRQCHTLRLRANELKRELNQIREQAMCSGNKQAKK